MPSGLQHPGAIALLAIVVAALLSLTPMVCEAWESSRLAWYRASPVSVESGISGEFVDVVHDIIWTDQD
jgi:hypothetical protein